MTSIHTQQEVTTMYEPKDPIDQLAAKLADLWANNPGAYRQGHLAGTRRLARLIRDGDPAALEAVGLGYLTRCGVDEGGKNYHGMRCDCWGPRDRP